MNKSLASRWILTVRTATAPLSSFVRLLTRLLLCGSTTATNTIWTRRHSAWTSIEYARVGLIDYDCPSCLIDRMLESLNASTPTSPACTTPHPRTLRHPAPTPTTTRDRPIPTVPIRACRRVATCESCRAIQSVRRERERTRSQKTVSLGMKEAPT